MKLKSIASLLGNRLRGKVVIVGVGNTDYQDDGAGVCLVEKLESSSFLKPIVVGDFPEFHLSEIISEVPKVVMFVDATELGSSPGSVAIIERNQLSDGWGNGHQPPLSIIMKYICKETGADTFLLGIQPEVVSCASKRGGNSSSTVGNTGNNLSCSAKITVQAISKIITEIVVRNEIGGSTACIEFMQQIQPTALAVSESTAGNFESGEKR